MATLRIYRLILALASRDLYIILLRYFSLFMFVPVTSCNLVAKITLAPWTPGPVDPFIHYPGTTPCGPKI